MKIKKYLDKKLKKCTLWAVQVVVADDDDDDDDNDGGVSMSVQR